MFAPVNTAAPDDRRKQLMQKLSQQGQTNLGQRSSIASSVGSSFRQAMPHGLVRAQGTQGTNVLPSVLARLGIIGNPKADEVSPGVGLPIGSPHGTPPPPIASGNPIPVMGVGVGGVPQTPGTAASPSSGASLTGDSFPGQPTQPNVGVGASLPGLSSSGGFSVSPFGPLGGNYGGIPLGGGHFFDPRTGQVTFNPAAAAGGAAGLVYGGSPRLL